MFQEIRRVYPIQRDPKKNTDIATKATQWSLFRGEYLNNEMNGLATEARAHLNKIKLTATANL